MKELINILGRIVLVITIIIIVAISVLFIIGIFNSYNNGIKELSLFNFSNNSDTYYGEKAVNEYFRQSLFNFGILSSMGILPIICMPSFVAILLRFKKLFSKEVIKYMIIVLIISILLHIIGFNDFIKYDIGLIILPYIESFIISYFIARKFYKMNNKNVVNN